MGEREVREFPFLLKAEFRRRSRLNHKAARSDGAVDTRSGTSVERAMEAENKKKKLEIIPKKSYKILDKRN